MWGFATLTLLKMCKRKKTQRTGIKVHEVELQDTDPDDEPNELFIGTITLKVNTVQSTPGSENIHVQGIPIKFKLDTGSEADILAKKDLDKLSGITIKPSKTKLISYSKHEIHSWGAHK